MKHKRNKYKDAERLGLPICEKCECLGETMKENGHREICLILGIDVTQSVFGGNSPCLCPKRLKP